jgi:long-chain acyl-CoA synthetase
VGQLIENHGASGGGYVGKLRAPGFKSAGAPCGLKDYHDLPAFGLLHHAAKVVSDRDAVRYGDEIWSYQRVNEAAIQCAAMLQRLGVKPGDRVGILLPNVPEYIIALNGIWRAGGIAVAISPLMVADEVEALLRQTGCKHVVCLDLLSHLCNGQPDLIDHMLLVSIRKHLPAYKQLGYLWMRHQHTGHWSIESNEAVDWFWNAMESTTNRWQPITIDPASTPAYILPTGGTTGAPKAVTLSHTNLVANAWQQYKWTDESFGTKTMMAILPFFHSYGLSTTVMAGAAMGATLVLHHRYHTAMAIRLIEKHQPSVLHAVPAMLIAMNERLRKHPADLSSIDWVISGGAPLPENVAREFSNHSGALVVEGFGLSEASPVTHVGHLFREPRYGVIGLPLPETECRIVETVSGAVDLADGNVGELVIRGPQVMLGYWKNPKATRAAIRDGWLHTGDLAIRHADGYYSIVGRKKDLIITSGYNVYPCEVEEVIRGHESVQDVAVIGAPDPRRGEIVKAVVVLKSGHAWDEDSLDQHCTAALSKHKRPRVFEKCDGELPKNFLGKVVRRHLRDPEKPNTAPVTVSDSAEAAQTPEVQS